MTRSLKLDLARMGRPAALGLVTAILAVGLALFTISALAGGGSSLNSAQAVGPLQLVYSEFGRDSDTIWAAAPDDPSRRLPLAVVDHAPEYGIIPSLSPDGRQIAYTVLPPDIGYAGVDAPAEVWVISLEDGARRRVAVDADLPVAPVWSPQGDALVFRRSTPADGAAGSFQLVRATLDGAETVLLASDLGLFPVGFSPDGSLLYFVEVSAAGTDLGRVPAAGGPAALVAHLSDDFARDWHLSPDGTRLAYLAPQQTGDAVYYAAAVLDLNGAGGASLGASAAAAPPPAADEFNPIWHPNGRDLTVGRLAAGEKAAPALRMAGGSGGVGALGSPARGFDVPLAWSPDGGYLAVRNFEGTLVTAPGRSWVEVVAVDGQRERLSDVSDVEVLGWRSGGG